MKVAVVHDYFTTYAGAERVTKAILDMYPGADVFTLFDTLDDGDFLQGHRVRTSALDRFPFVRRYYRLLFPLFPWSIERFDASGYDLIISSSHSAAKGIRTAPGQVHICYCHSPARWAWDLKRQYLEQSGLLGTVRGRIVSKLIERFRKWDAETSTRVTHFVANSDFIRRRIEAAYGRDATVIHPPVDTVRFALQERKKRFYVVVARLVWYKRVDAVVDAFNAMPDRHLVVVGDGPLMRKVRGRARPNVEVRGPLDSDDLRRTIGSARAMVYPAEEDFGIAIVEAQACGTPVIALGRGGARETVIDGETGIFFDEQSPDAIKEAVERFESMRFDAKRIRRHAESFSTQRFADRFQRFVDQCV